jgi:hypothetical protein
LSRLGIGRLAGWAGPTAGIDEYFGSLSGNVYKFSGIN